MEWLKRERDGKENRRVGEGEREERERERREREVKGREREKEREGGGRDGERERERERAREDTHTQRWENSPLVYFLSLHYKLAPITPLGQDPTVSVTITKPG